MYEAVIRLWMISAIGMDVKKSRKPDPELAEANSSGGSGNIFLAYGQSTCGGKKAGVSDHAMLRAGAHAFEMPKAHQGFHRLDTSKPLIVAQRVD
jgi:hypothetical protein